PRDTSVVQSSSAIIPSIVQTEHVAKLRSGTMAYKTQTGYIQLKDEDGNPKGNVFFIAYLAKDRKDRPVTFAFNGGPGSASVWVNLGFMGPKRPNLTDAGDAQYPYSYNDNPETWLDKTDIVFIDPISTGYSRAVRSEEHTSELQSRENLVCRLLLEKKKK